MAQYRCLKPAFVDNSMREIGDVVTIPDATKVAPGTFELIEEPEDFEDPVPPKPSAKRRRKPKPKDDSDVLD